MVPTPSGAAQGDGPRRLLAASARSTACPCSTSSTPAASISASACSPRARTHHKRRSLYADNFLCLFSPEQLKLSPPISLEDYLRVPHVLTSLSDDAHGAVDEALAKQKLKRTIAMTTPGFLAVPFVLRRAPVITTMPSRLARYFAEAFGLATSRRPDRAAELHHLVALACEFRPGSGASLAPPDGVGACLGGGFGALKRRDAGCGQVRYERACRSLRLASSWRLIDSRPLGVRLPDQPG